MANVYRAPHQPVSQWLDSYHPLTDRDLVDKLSLTVLSGGAGTTSDMASVVSIRSMGRPKVVHVRPPRSRRRTDLQIDTSPAPSSSFSSAASAASSDPPSPLPSHRQHIMSAQIPLKSMSSELSLNYKNFSHKIRIVRDSSPASVDLFDTPRTPHPQLASFSHSPKASFAEVRSYGNTFYPMPSPALSEKDSLSDSDGNYYETDSMDGIDAELAAPFLEHHHTALPIRHSPTYLPATHGTTLML